MLGEGKGTSLRNLFPEKQFLIILTTHHVLLLAQQTLLPTEHIASPLFRPKPHVSVLEIVWGGGVSLDLFVPLPSVTTLNQSPLSAFHPCVSGI